MKYEMCFNNYNHSPKNYAELRAGKKLEHNFELRNYNVHK